MLPDVHGMFALVRDLANGREITEIPIAPWYVERHNLGPLVARAGASAFRNELIRSTVGWARIERALPPLIEQLHAIGVRVAVLKGVSYATSIYEVPAERPMTDIDLLVSPLLDTAKLFERLGFEWVPNSPFHHAQTYFKGDTIVDLHKNFVSRARAGVDISGVFARATPTGPFGTLRLSPVDELAFHLVHMWRGRLCGPLVQIIDLHRLAQRADPAAALARAAEWKLGRGARRAYHYYRSILDGDIDLHYATVDDIVHARQPSIPRRIAFELATAESPKALAAHAFDVFNQRVFAGRPSGEARGR
jgi:hypothetical protein